MGYELAEQLGWVLPDVIIYPTGGGTGLVGMWKAFQEMEELGVRSLPLLGLCCSMPAPLNGFPPLGLASSSTLGGHVW